MKKLLQILGLFTLAILLVYSAGDHPPEPILSARMPEVPRDLVTLDDSVRRSESSPLIKDNNQSRIVWANDQKHAKTTFSVVYLHGFSASQEEGSPIHREFARRYGCNLFLARLAQHGLKDSDAFKTLTPDRWYESAKSALAIGAKLGDSVILMATSAGGTMALTLAAKEANIPLKALILYSPCIKIFDPLATLLDKPWGLEIARYVSNGKYLRAKQNDSIRKYWNATYRIEGAVALQKMIDVTMHRQTFAKVHLPVLCLIYYKNAKEQDSTVQVSAIREMMSELGTPEREKVLKALPKAGNHVLASSLRSHDLASVRAFTDQFSEKILGLKPQVGR